MRCRAWSVPALALCGALFIAGCDEETVSPAPGAAVAVKAAERTAILVGAGDIAACESTGDEATAALLDQIDGTVFTAGDNAYENGSPVDYASCYEPSWGRHKARTRPSVGNHEYLTPGAAGYFAYYGDRSGPPGLGYYSYDLGAWHVIVLNSMLAYVDPVQQKAWLIHDLRTHPRRCTLAYWHHPRFSSGLHGNAPQMKGFWRILYAHDADVVVSGHDHDYERFAPQDANGLADPGRGIREFVVGTGGKSLRAFSTIQPNSEVRYNDTFAVIRLVLRPSAYHWELIAAPSGAVVDSGDGRCH